MARVNKCVLYRDGKCLSKTIPRRQVACSMGLIICCRDCTKRLSCDRLLSCADCNFRSCECEE
jgi:hypothetical protein